MNQRTLVLICIVLLLPAICFMVLHFISDPMGKSRMALANELKRIPQNVEFPAADDWPFDKWNENILSKSALFDALVPKPEPPKPPPPPPPTPPDLCQKLQGVTPTRMQIGKSKIKIITPDNPRGGFKSLGDKIADCTLADFDKQGAIFTFHWREGNKKMTCTIDLQGNCQPLE